MKTMISFLFLACLASAAMGQSALPNGNFEAWTYHSAYGYYEPDGGFFKTLNVLQTTGTPPGISAYPTDSAHGGNKAIRLVTRKIDVLQVVIPGVTGTITIDWANSTGILGTPYTWNTKPERFQGWYMAFPLNGDSTGAILLLSKWNSSTNQRDTIAHTKLIFQGTVNTYTEFDAPITYWNTTTMPDSITLLLVASGGYNANQMFGSVGQVGSQAYFDDVTLTNIAGIEMLLMPDVNVTLAPNPASGRMQVTLSEPVKNSLFEVYDPQGKLVQRYPLEPLSTTLDVSSLMNGLYYYKVTNDSKKLNTGSFVIAK